MTDDLGEKLAVLTEARPEPADPAAPIRQRITRRRRRRQLTATMLTAAAVAAAALGTGPALGALRSDEPAPPMAGDIVSETKRLPEPWSDQLTPIVKLPELPDQPNPSYVFAEGGFPPDSWIASLVHSQNGCITVFEGTSQKADVLIKPVCLGKTTGKPVWTQSSVFTTSKGSFTMFVGSVDVKARTVRLSYRGPNPNPLLLVPNSHPAVATPASDTRRFFAIAIPWNPAVNSVEAIRAYDEAGRELK